MNKKHLYQLHKRFAILNTWLFLAVAVFFLIVGVLALRQNNLTMVELRDKVIQTDQDDGDVDKALNDLRSFVFSHMNTNLASGDFAIKPPIQLKSRYDRLVVAEQARVQEANRQVNAEAETRCRQQFPGDGPNIPRVSCIQQYVSVSAVEEQPIPAELYKFDFISPRWTPDVAGISLVLSGIFFLCFAARFAVERWFMYQIK